MTVSFAGTYKIFTLNILQVDELRGSLVIPIDGNDVSNTVDFLDVAFFEAAFFAPVAVSVFFLLLWSWCCCPCCCCCPSWSPHHQLHRPLHWRRPLCHPTLRCSCRRCHRCRHHQGRGKREWYIMNRLYLQISWQYPLMWPLSSCAHA